MSVVIDNGSLTTKFGLSTDKEPKLVESVVGYERGKKQVELYVGLEQIKKLRKDPNKTISTRYPIQRGIFLDWDQMEALWSHCQIEKKFVFIFNTAHLY